MGLTYYGSRISDNITKTPEGFLICTNVPIARIGDLQYLARELDIPDKASEDMVTVHRDRSEVFHPAALASFEGKPVTNGHPPLDVDIYNNSLYNAGHCQNVRTQGDYIVADLYITDPNLVNDVENKNKRDVSCGYTCKYLFNEDGTLSQTEIRGNHIAIVNEGRAGKTVSIKDQKFEERRKSMGNNKPITKSGSILQLFGHSVRDAKSPEEMDHLIENAEIALETSNDPNNEPNKEEVSTMQKTKDCDPQATPIAENALLAGIGELTKAVQGLRSALPIVEAQSQPQTQDCDTPKVLDSNDPVQTSPEGETDTSMEELDKLVEEQDADPTTSVDVQESEDKVTVDPDEISVQDSDGTEGADGYEENPVKKIVQDMKPVFAKISNQQERKSVCDAFAKSLRLNVVNNSSLAQIMDANIDSAISTRDSKPEYTIEDQQSYYDSLNPHIKK